MPSSPGYVRNYKQESRTESPLRKKKRNMRNKARRMSIKAGLVKRNDGKDVHHKDGNAMNTKRGNLSVKAASKNRSFPRTKSAGKKYKYSQENKMATKSKTTYSPDYKRAITVKREKEKLKTGSGGGK